MKDRYLRQTGLPEIGPEGQHRLVGSRAVIVGCGALGTAAALYLAGAGVGDIVVVDYDTVDLSNLQRQPAFTETDLRQPKAQVLARRVAALNSEITVHAVNEKVSENNFSKLTDNADILVEGTDNPSTKYLITGLCERKGLPYVIGGVSGFKGQAMSWLPGATPYKSVFQVPGDDYVYSPPAVLGPLPGIVGCVQAAEVIKYLGGTGFTLVDRLLLVDILEMDFRTILLI